jgi:hypothetical protein
VSRGRPGSRRARKVIGVVMVIGLIGYGAVLLGLGLSGFANAHALATSGVPALARVSATSGYGKNTIQVTYQVHGRPVQGTVGADPSRVHQGEPLAVVYDPGHPQVVSLASDVGDTSPARVETILGAFFLALVPLCFLLALVSARRRRRRAAQAAPGRDSI